MVNLYSLWAVAHYFMVDDPYRYDSHKNGYLPLDETVTAGGKRFNVIKGGETTGTAASVQRPRLRLLDWPPSHLRTTILLFQTQDIWRLVRQRLKRTCSGAESMTW